MPKREFLHVDELADACAFLLNQDNPPDLLNIGTGTDVTIRELTELVARVTGFKGTITWDSSKPDGTPRKLMDVSRMTALGWKARIGVREGVEKTYASFLAEKRPARCAPDGLRSWLDAPGGPARASRPFCAVDSPVLPRGFSRGRLSSCDTGCAAKGGRLP
ncbi:MAG: hypothetical protein WDM96_03915 [Lacunisphaera sp.]